MENKNSELEKLKRKSSKWNFEQWEEYLKTLEGSYLEESAAFLESYISKYLTKEYLRKFKSHSCLISKTQKKKYKSDIYLDKVNIVLSQLSENQRKIVELIFWEDKSEREIAKILGTTRPSVQKSKKRALENLKRILTMSSTFLLGEEEYSKKRKEVESEEVYQLAQKAVV